jgi:hypothetical protein
MDLNEIHVINVETIIGDILKNKLFVETLIVWALINLLAKELGLEQKVKKLHMLKLTILSSVH